MVSLARSPRVTCGDARCSDRVTAPSATRSSQAGRAPLRSASRPDDQVAQLLAALSTADTVEVSDETEPDVFMYFDVA